MKEKSIVEKAEKLGIKAFSSNTKEQVEEIAYKVGFKDFDINTDLDSLEELLNQRLLKDEQEFNDDNDKRNNEKLEETIEKVEEVRNKAEEIKDRVEKAKKIKEKVEKAKKIKETAETAKVVADTTAATGTAAGGTAAAGGAAAGGTAAAGGAAAGGTAAGGAAAGGGAVAGGAGSVGLFGNPYFWLVVLIIFILLLLYIIITGAVGGSSDSDYSGLYGYDYVEPKCNKIQVEGLGVYDIEEYVAGVVQDEASVFLNDSKREAAKAIAVIARTYVQLNADENCSIGNSSATQNFTIAGSAARKAVEETHGLVLTDASGNFKLDSGYGYDALCTNQPQNDPDYYILCQKDQKIPREWALKQNTIKNNPQWLEGNKSNAHGKGLSMWGAAYLAEEQKYTYKEIISYYFDDLETKSIFSSFQFAEEYPTNPKDEMYAGKPLLINKSIDDLLEEHGLTTITYNDFLISRITHAGIGTRDAVVTAALTLIGSMAEMGYKINYLWGGKYEHIGINTKWGAEHNSSWYCDIYPQSQRETCDTNYQWFGFDCTGFVTWAIINGFQNSSLTQSDTYSSKEKRILPTETEANCQPGDVMHSPTHAILVIDIDEENKRIIFAESAGSRISTGSGGVQLSSLSFSHLRNSGYECHDLSELYSKY